MHGSALEGLSSGWHCSCGTTEGPRGCGSIVPGITPPLDGFSRSPSVRKSHARIGRHASHTSVDLRGQASHSASNMDIPHMVHSTLSLASKATRVSSRGHRKLQIPPRIELLQKYFRGDHPAFFALFFSSHTLSSQSNHLTIQNTPNQI